MKDIIFSKLQKAWSSVIGGVDIKAASESIERYVIEEIHSAVEKNAIIHRLEQARLHNDLDSFEEDLEASTTLLEGALSELLVYKDMQSNNKRKHQELSDLIYKIEEQIIKNGQ